MAELMNTRQLEASIKAWLQEDMPFGDVTTMNLLCTDTGTVGQLIAKEAGILCGIQVFEMVFSNIGQGTKIQWFKKDGDPLKTGDAIALITGALKEVLMAERLALNLLQRMSGIATASRAYSEAIKNYPCRVVDTRKTTPGLRQLEKYAVRVGGCHNHRYSLSDAVMIKDNHIKAAGSITQAVSAIRTSLPHTMKIEVEVESLEGLEEALDNQVDIIMLDNMTNTTMAEAVQRTNKRAILEASGNMTLDRIPTVAATGVDVISVGALTHSAKALDISLKFQ